MYFNRRPVNWKSTIDSIHQYILIWFYRTQYHFHSDWQKFFLFRNIMFLLASLLFDAKQPNQKSKRKTHNSNIIRMDLYGFIPKGSKFSVCVCVCAEHSHKQTTTLPKKCFPRSKLKSFFFLLLVYGIWYRCINKTVNYCSYLQTHIHPHKWIPTFRKWRKKTQNIIPTAAKII